MAIKKTVKKVAIAVAAAAAVVVSVKAPMVLLAPHPSPDIPPAPKIDTVRTVAPSLGIGIQIVP
jgi:hypothetical protein